MTIRNLVCHALNRLYYPLLPPKKRQPFRYFIHCAEGGAEPELLHLDKLSIKRGTAIDVGANLGFYSYRMSQLFRQVHSFEVNGSLLENLSAYNPGNISIHPMGLSSSEQELTLYTPLLHGKPLHGWASLTPGNCPDTNDHETQKVRVVTLDSMDIHDVSFIKIDVEGHEVEMLKGAAETIGREKPVVLIEIKDHNLAIVREFFQKYGYKETSLRELAGMEGSPENRIFVPSQA